MASVYDFHGTVFMHELNYVFLARRAPCAALTVSEMSAPELGPRWSRFCSDPTRCILCTIGNECMSCVTDIFIACAALVLGTLGARESPHVGIGRGECDVIAFFDE